MRLLSPLPRLASAFFHTLFGPSPCCRFEPSCSAYFSQAIARHGLFLGTKLGVLRLLRCRPGTPGGWDPVPEAEGVVHGK